MPAPATLDTKRKNRCLLKKVMGARQGKTQFTREDYEKIMKNTTMSKEQIMVWEKNFRRRHVKKSGGYLEESVDSSLPIGRVRRIWGIGNNMNRAFFKALVEFDNIKPNARMRELLYVEAAIDTKKNRTTFLLCFQAQVEMKALYLYMTSLGAKGVDFNSFSVGSASNAGTARALYYMRNEAPTSGNPLEIRFRHGHLPEAIETKLQTMTVELCVRAEMERRIENGKLPKKAKVDAMRADDSDDDEEAQVESDEEEEEVESEEEEVQDEVVEEEEEEEAEEEEEDEEEVAEEEEELSEIELMRKLLGLYGTTMTEVKVQNRLLIGNYDALQKQNEVLVVTNDTTLHRNQKLTEQLARLSRKYTKAKEELDHWEHSFFPIADESFRFFQQFRMAAKERKETLVAFQGLIANIKNMDHDEDDNVKSKKRLVREIQGIRAELVRLQPALEASVELMRKDRANARAHDAVVQ